MREAVIDITPLRKLRVPRRLMVRGALAAAAAIAVYALLAAVLYQVGPDEVAVVQRFGRFARTGGPGLRLQWPFIEKVTAVPVLRQLRQEFGFRTPADPKQAKTAHLDESTMLTGDLNVAVVEWIVQYRVADVYKYLFRVRGADTIFRDLTGVVMEQAVGDRTLTEVVTVGRQAIEAAVQTELQRLADQYEMGLRVDQVVLQSVDPPDPVKPSWDEVNQAQQQRDRLINEARSEYNTIVPKARGEAAQAILAADGYALDRVNRAHGDASRFVQLDQAYKAAPDVTRRRLQFETMSRVLTQIGGKIVIDQGAKGVVPLLPLDRLRQVLTPLSSPASDGVASSGSGTKAGGAQ